MSFSGPDTALAAGTLPKEGSWALRDEAHHRQNRPGFSTKIHTHKNPD